MQVNRTDDLKVATFEQCYRPSMNFTHYFMNNNHLYSSINADSIIAMPMGNKGITSKKIAGIIPAHRSQVYESMQ
ncbi:hypothetical protein AM1_F0043 (plasmid) [Acaryochloris marina MBIC11017]|uniref:Uncharacterized protein n=1 Tax=Acaryochloris marina (strain MBIC 11017) TaxID=329726 RepID=A8ZQ26_ACAM1|nr:hypothetical protein AM1_F0043 [Acaryochloris marina MBIC11017]